MNTTTTTRATPSTAWRTSTDHQLVRDAAAGDSRAFDELVRRHQRRMASVAATFVRNQQDIEDLVQETFIKAHRSIDRFDGRSKVTTWLGRICENTCIDHLRRRRLTLVELDEAIEPGNPAGPAGGTDDGNALFEVQDLLAELDDPVREAVVLIDVVGHTAATAARTVGVPASTMRSRVGQGRRQLRDSLVAA